MSLIAAKIAWSYITHRKDTTILSMILICFISITLSTAALSLVHAIMRGFEQATLHKFKSINADISITAAGNALDYPKLSRRLLSEHHHIKNCAPRTSRNLLITSSARETPIVALLIAIDPVQESETTTLGQALTTPASLHELIYDNRIIIGHELAHQLACTQTDNVTLLYNTNTSMQGRKITFDEADAVIAHTFKTGIDEYDSHLIFCSFELMDSLFDQAGIEQINCALSDYRSAPLIIEKIESNYGLEAYEWLSLYQPLICALALEKYMSILVISLITLVACLNLISLLSLYIAHQRSDIALLYTLGMHVQEIRSIFIILGVALTICGVIAGLLISWLCSFAINDYHLFKLPDAYYVTHLPADFDFLTSLALGAVVIILGIATTWYATKPCRYETIATTLKRE